MTFLHLSDLHLGKRLGAYELYDEQRQALSEIAALCKQRGPDAVLIAGDVYDKPVPTLEAVRLFDRFLCEISELGIPVLILSGNHDSGERLGFASELIEKSGVHIAGGFDGEPLCVTLQDQYGPVHFWLLPFVRPATVRAALAAKGLETGEITDYTSAVRAALAQCAPDPAQRNVLAAHQFVTWRGQAPERCDSETLNTGGLDDVDASVFDLFDYVALGHLHGPQRVGRDQVRYAGSPFPYSVSEQRHRKSACLVTLAQKGEVSFELLPLHPLRGVRAVEGTLNALCSPDFPGREPRDDYVFARVVEDGPMDRPLARLREIYPKLLGMEILRPGGQPAELDPSRLQAARLEPMAALDDFFQRQAGRPLSDRQRRFALDAFEQLKEEDE